MTAWRFNTFSRADDVRARTTIRTVAADNAHAAAPFRPAGGLSGVFGTRTTPEPETASSVEFSGPVDAQWAAGRSFVAETGARAAFDIVWIDERAYTPMAQSAALRRELDAANEALASARQLAEARHAHGGDLRRVLAESAKRHRETAALLAEAEEALVAFAAGAAGSLAVHSLNEVRDPETVADWLRSLLSLDTTVTFGMSTVERIADVIADLRGDLASAKAGRTYTDLQLGAASDAAIRTIFERGDGPIIYGPLVEAIATALGMRRAEA